ncbi:hypothetical protein [Cohnella zeiphila]|uniref:Uncharacterized protein n=1 Tax=Cohnella zeiphila TaxID=2761120 RepID=A0A7X0SKF6_9BACL|nr:hypothetical protein [Cohnella zeiphila]MBB6731638.1 hypothetical protein [Cohnella zeiphila]
MNENQPSKPVIVWESRREERSVGQSEGEATSRVIPLGDAADAAAPVIRISSSGFGGAVRLTARPSHGSPRAELRSAA